MSTSQSVDHFVSQLKRRQIYGSNHTALETAQLLRTVISNSRWTNAASLIQHIRELSVRLLQAQPVEFAVGNITRRVLHLIREEYRNSTKEIPQADSTTSLDSKVHESVKSAAGDSSMFNLLADSTAPAMDYSRQCFQLKQLIIQGVNEIIDELESVSDTLAQQSLEHIHSNEIIMTIGRSKAVEKFLLSAAKKRQFQVIVAEGSPAFGGHQLCKSLASAGVETLLISDAAIFALMARVNKVIIGCHAVTANGGLIAPSGCQLIATAAKHHSTPVCVVTGLYKLTPIYPENHDTFNILGNPDAVLPFSDGDLMHKVDVVNPHFDYVPPPYVSLFITNTGGHPPSYVYRLLREMYDLEDYTLE
jgi:translation initiation factor eIF-2B subunit beta